MPDGPLTGLRVLDLTEGIAGPFCTKLLGDSGAEVIKVEPPHVGDWTRHRGPFYRDVPDREHSMLFAYLNTNKRSVTLNLDTSFGQGAVRRLAASADVLVEAYPPGYLDERGLSPQALRESLPRLVISSLSLFDRRGPYSHYSGTEINLYAMTGLMDLVGGIGRPPLKAGSYQAQYMAGLQACAFCLFAAYRARVSGEGAYIDSSVVEAGAKIGERSGPKSAEADARFKPDERRERSNRVHPCFDGYMTVTLYYFQVKALADLLGKPSLATDPRFADEAAFTENLMDMHDEVGQWLADKTASEAQEAGQKRHLLFTKVQSVGDILESDHFRARDFFVEVDHPVFGRGMYPAPRFRPDESYAGSLKAAPLLGEATEEVLCQRLGYEPADLVPLHASGAI